MTLNPFYWWLQAVAIELRHFGEVLTTADLMSAEFYFYQSYTPNQYANALLNWRRY
jgi:hypothetical protein